MDVILGRRFTDLKPSRPTKICHSHKSLRRLKMRKNSMENPKI